MKTSSGMGLLPKIMLAIVSGVACSLFFPSWAVRLFLTFNSVFSNFLSLFIPILIIGLIAPGIGDLGKGAGKLLFITTALAYSSTVIAGFFSFGVCSATYGSVLGDSLNALENINFQDGLKPFFTIEMPPFMSVTTALVVAFTIGLCLAGMDSEAMRNLMYDTRFIVFKVINKIIIPCLPLFIFGIFLFLSFFSDLCKI